MKILLLLLCIVSNFALAEINHGALLNCKTDVFIGTGIESGLNIVHALQSNFEEVYFIENDKILVEHSRFVIATYFKNKIPEHIKFSLLNYNSKWLLAPIINNINKEITFLLSSHLPDLDDPQKPNNILLELEQIKQHSIKTHTILIDYINYTGEACFGNISLESIMSKILEINPHYKFKFKWGGRLANEKNALLYAYV